MTTNSVCPQRIRTNGLDYGTDVLESDVRRLAIPITITTSTTGAAELSPNQLDKQRQIIEAAKTVLARDGLAACTARAVADESPLTKSAIHYYFDTVEEIIDRAMESHIDAFLEQLRVTGAGYEDPIDRLWAVIAEYLRTFEERPTIATLWFAYWVAALEDGRRAPVERMHNQVIEMLADLLKAAGTIDPAAHARALFSYLLGTVMRQAISRTSFDDLVGEIAALCGLRNLALPAQRLR